MNATCSPNEQDTAKPVHQMNKPVHKTNDLVQEMNNPVSFGEQDQAQNDPYKTIDKTSNKTSLQEERESVSANASTPRAISDNLSDDHAFEDEDTVERPAIPKFEPPPKQNTPSHTRVEDHERMPG